MWSTAKKDHGNERNIIAKSLKAKLELMLFGFQELLLDLNKSGNSQWLEFRSSHRRRWVTTASTAENETRLYLFDFSSPWQQRDQEQKKLIKHPGP